MSSNANNLLQPGQAVFIRNNSSVTTVPSIEFTQASKQVSGSQLTTFATPDYSVLNVQLISPNSNGLVLDGIGMRFDDSFNNEVGDEDAGKIGNSGENMAIVRSNQLLSIERRNYPFQGESHQLFVNNLQQQNYALKLMTENYTSDLDVIVVDNYLGTETLITEGNDYTFTAQPNVPESVSPFRFELKFDIISLGSENQLAQNISLYPVPVNNVLNIQYINDSKLSVEVINLLGQVVTKANVEGGNLHQIDMSELASGVYVVKISSENETFTQQVIKK